MYLTTMTSCCGFGELTELEEDKEDLEHNYISFEEVIQKIKEQKINNNHNYPPRIYKTILATTPDKLDWHLIHVALDICGFKPITTEKSFHGDYQNILWMYKRK